jgi:hypothetical protein
MPERASVFQVYQCGLEGTVGTQAAANKTLTSLSIEATPNVEVTRLIANEIHFTI